MDILGLKQEVPQDPVGQVHTRDGYPNIAMVDLGREVSEAVRATWPAAHPFHSGGAIDSAWLLPFIGAGSTAASSLFAGNVFLATANPATLMTIGAGVGSAVMGPTGIIAHAPFVAASTALMPVMAPVMLFMTVSSMMTGARLGRVQRALGALSEGLERVRRLMEAEDYARLVSAADQLDGIGSQFEHGQRFTDDMKIALMLAKRDVNQLHHKFGHLLMRQVRSEENARLSVADINRFVLSSLADLWADALHLQLTLQDDPPSAERRETVLRKKVTQCADTFRELLDHNPVEAFRDRLRQELYETGRLEFLPWGLTDTAARAARTLGRGRSVKNTIRTVETILSQDFAPVGSRMERWISEYESSATVAREESMVIYREREGRRDLKVHHTRDVRLVQTAA